MRQAMEFVIPYSNGETAEKDLTRLFLGDEPRRRLVTRRQCCKKTSKGIRQGIHYQLHGVDHHCRHNE